MSKNIPYDQDSGILSTIIGTGVLAGGAYASWYAITDEAGFQDSLSKVVNKVFPVVTDLPNEFQSINMKSNEALTAGSRYASMARTSAYKQAAAKRSMIAHSFDINPTLGKDVATRALNAVSSISGGVTDFTTFGYQKGSKELAGFEENFVKAVNRITGVVGGYSFKGTSMHFDVGGHSPLKLHIPKFNKDLGVWMAKEEDKTLRVHKAINVAYTKSGDKYLLDKARNPLEHILETLSNPMSLIYHMNKGTDANGYDVRLLNKMISTDEEYAAATSFEKKQKIITAKYKALKDQGKLRGELNVNFTGMRDYEVQELFDQITREQGRFVFHDEVNKMKFYGNQGQIDPLSRIINEENFQQISVRNLDGATTGADIKRFYSSILSDLGISGGWYLNQDSTQKGIFSTLLPHTGMGQSEQFKGVSKGVRMYKDVAARRTVTGMTSPLIKNASTKPGFTHFAKDEPVLNLLSIIDPSISDTILLDRRIGERFKVITSKTYTMNSLVGAAKDDSSGLSAKIFAKGKTEALTKEWNSLDDFYRYIQESGLDIRSNYEEIKFGSRTVFGLNSGNDIVRGLEDLPMARELGQYGNPVLAHTNGFISQDNLVTGYKSWIKSQAEGGPVQLTVSLVEDSKKISEYYSKLRTSMSLLNDNAPTVITANPVQDLAGSERRLAKLVPELEELQLKKEGFIAQLEQTNPGIRATLEQRENLKIELDQIIGNIDGFNDVKDRLKAARLAHAEAIHRYDSLSNMSKKAYDARYKHKAWSEHKYETYRNLKKQAYFDSHDTQIEIQELEDQLAEAAHKKGLIDRDTFLSKRQQYQELREQHNLLFRRSRGQTKGLTKALNQIHRKQLKIESARSMVTSIDGVQAWDWFKGTIIKDGKLGKNSPEYLTFLQNSIMGHALYSDADIVLDMNSKFGKAFGKISNVKTVNPNGNMSLKQIIRDKNFRMLQSEASYGNRVYEAQRVLASLRSGAALTGGLETHTSANAILDEVFNVMEEVKGGNLTRKALIDGKKAWAYYGSYIGNETTSSALGMGENRFAFGLKELHLLRGNEGILKELGVYNLVDSQTIFNQGDLALSAIANKTFDTTGIETLTKENAATTIGPGYEYIEKSGALIGEPEVRMNTIFGNSSISERGLAVKVTEESGEIGLRYVPSSTFWGANQYLGELDMMARTKDQISAAELFKSALLNSGQDAIAGKEATARFDRDMMAIHTDFAKHGYTRTGALQVATATYDSNVVEHSVLGNKTLLRMLEGGGEEALAFRKMIGSTVMQSESLYRQTMVAKLEQAKLIAEASTHGDVLRTTKELFGVESLIYRAMSEAKGDTAEAVNIMTKNSMDLSRRLTEAAHSIVTKDKLNDIDIKNIRELMNEIKSKSDVGLYLRDPVLYPHSGLSAYTLAADSSQIAQDKMLAGGDMIAMLMNMDNDGDKIKQFMLLSKESRVEALRNIAGEQESSYRILKAVKDNKMARPIGSWIEELPTGFQSWPKDQIERLTAATKSLGETEGAVAAYTLKALTGSVDVRTHGLVSEMLKAAKEKGFNPSEYREMELFAGNVFPFMLVQESISSKHIARGVDGESRLIKMLNNIGGISKEEFVSNLRASGGEVDVLSFFTITNKLREGGASNAWVEEILPELDTLFAAHRNLRTIKKEEYLKATKLLQYTSDQAEEGWRKREQALAEMSAEEARPLFERGDAVEKFGYTDLRQLSKMTTGRELKNLEYEFRRRLYNKPSGMLESDVLKETLASILNSGFGERTQASREMLGGVKLVSRRSIIGLNAVKSFISEHIINHPTRMAGLAGAAMVGMAAVNMLFGDGSPQDPNDLPSVNNPSFRDNRYNSMLESRHLNNVPNANVSSGLLTDSYNSYDSITSHLQASFGNHYSSVSVRHDGQDPYKGQMLRYNT